MTIASNPAAAAIPTEAMPAGVDAGSQVPSAAPAATRVTVGAANLGLHPTPVEPAAAVITLLAASERHGTDRCDFDRCDTDRCDMDRRDMDRLDPNLPDSRPVAANPSDPARSGATVADPTPASADLEQPAATESDLAALTRPDFPLLSQIACLGQPLIYLDYAATSQKPRQVLAALQHYYGHDNANVHRGAHQLSARATEGFEHAREKVTTFVGAASPREIVYTRNASEAINLVARTWGEANLRAGDEVLLSVMEHHSNLVPWQLLAARTGCVLRHAGLTPTGELDLADWRSKLSERTRLVSLVQVSNTLGCLNPIAELAPLTHAAGALLLVDACQSLPHQRVNVAELGCDFLVGSSHKFCGPTGMGFLWAREALLEAMPPFLGGGEMIQDVGLDTSTWADLPHKFEAGTPAIGEAIGMGAAIDYLQAIGMDRIHAWEQRLTRQLFARLQAIEGLTILGPTPEQQPDRAALAAFSVEGLHANDIAALLDSAGICIRSGHHCTQPLHRHYGLSGTARASLGFTTTPEEIDRFAEELQSTIGFLREHS